MGFPFGIIGNGETLFREMSLSTRLLSVYLEDDAREYLKGIVTSLMNSLSGIESVMDVPAGTIASSEQLITVKSNLQRIMEISQNFLDQVLTSANRFPMYSFLCFKFERPHRNSLISLDFWHEGIFDS
jgi:hypothetical protein